MKIGQVAAEAGVSVDTVRFYERRGLVATAQRLTSGYRVYGPATVARIRLARRLQELGMSLEEIIDALHSVDGTGTGGGAPAATCASERWRLEVVVDRIDARIAELRALRREVNAALAACDRGACTFADIDISER